jgi:hypothetical protein
VPRAEATPCFAAPTERIWQPKRRCNQRQLVKGIMTAFILQSIERCHAGITKFLSTVPLSEASIASPNFSRG